MKKIYFSLLTITLLFSGCVKEMDGLIQNELLQNTLANAGVNKEIISSAATVSKGIASASEDFTPEQEYYIGRTVSAQILAKYKPYNNQKANNYINQIGYQLAIHSKIPMTYSGYHFMILDSDEINAFAAPGGFVFITRGLLRCANNEDEVAAILAHEISHITNNHPISAIKTSRWSDLGVNIATEVAKKHTKGTLGNLLNIYDGSIKDITNTMINNGYSRTQEYEADATAIDVLKASGYNSKSMIDMLHLMQTKLTPNSSGFATTHPSASDRVASLNKLTIDQKTIPKVRIDRFKSILSKI